MAIRHFRRAGSDQATRRHMKHQVYRCCLPTLAGFTGIHCIGPNLQRCPTARSPTPQPQWGIQSSYSGLLVQGSATSPPSTTNFLINIKNIKSPAYGEKATFILEPTVGIEPTTCGLRNRCSTDWATLAYIHKSARTNLPYYPIILISRK